MFRIFTRRAITYRLPNVLAKRLVIRTSIGGVRETTQNDNNSVSFEVRKVQEKSVDIIPNTELISFHEQLATKELNDIKEKYSVKKFVEYATSLGIDYASSEFLQGNPLIKERHYSKDDSLVIKNNFKSQSEFEEYIHYLTKISYYINKMTDVTKIVKIMIFSESNSQFLTLDNIKKCLEVQNCDFLNSDYQKLIQYMLSKGVKPDIAIVNNFISSIQPEQQSQSIEIAIEIIIDNQLVPNFSTWKAIYRNSNTYQHQILEKMMELKLPLGKLVPRILNLGYNPDQSPSDFTNLIEAFPESFRDLTLNDYVRIHIYFNDYETCHELFLVHIESKRPVKPSFNMIISSLIARKNYAMAISFIEYARRISDLDPYSLMCTYSRIFAALLDNLKNIDEKNKKNFYKIINALYNQTNRHANLYKAIKRKYNELGLYSKDTKRLLVKSDLGVKGEVIGGLMWLQRPIWNLSENSNEYKRVAGMIDSIVK
ncbi:hypothetical protein CANARDRAFT_27491 [[Candida] arabinofermentans NRRL YB-2248]|uniref:Uncharacterized protein n=1 Tax=[Candida] arabinofermentans NRRL YB-2248 TaxID=983967 RepID=A0A1E4T3B6_9ASCO|nr:hypothetical protein CANARDRAFT_27491 [[Candida] arabinofermentans NRRL YB-2248]